MKHPTPEQLKPLLNAIDVAVWAYAVKTQSRKSRVKVDFKGAMQDLTEAFHMFQLATDDRVLVTSDGGGE